MRTSLRLLVFCLSLLLAHNNNPNILVEGTPTTPAPTCSSDLSGVKWATLPTWLPDGKEILFLAGDSYHSQLYILKIDSKQVCAVTQDDNIYLYYVVSADGQHVALVFRAAPSQSEAPRPPSNGISIINTDGSGYHRLLNYDLSLNQFVLPSWSPDGNSIAFVWEYPGQGSSNLSTVRLDGSHLTMVYDSYNQISSQHWSPNGKQIAFIRPNTNSTGSTLYIVNADGSGLRQMTKGDLNLHMVQWSPDSQRIATVVSDNNGGIYIFDIRKSKLVRLTDGGIPTWSPDGKMLAYASHEENKSALNLINADGTHQQQLTHCTCLYIEPVSWSPDGKQLAFASNQDGNYQIYVVNIDGTNLTRLTG